MNATELFKAGQLQNAIQEQLKDVKANPADHGRRLFLFELLAFAGDLDRARRQINAIEYGDMERDTAILAYKRLLDIEQARRKFFQTGGTPTFMVDPPEHVQWRVQAADLLRQDRTQEAGVLLQKANAAIPQLQGEWNGQAFEGIRDCDDLFGSVLEVMALNYYYWVPLEQVRAIHVKPPRFPRDVLWLSAELELQSGKTGEVFLPTLYPGSQAEVDEALQLGRTVDWRGPEEGPVTGVGMRMFQVGDDTVSLLEWRQLKLA